MPRNPMIKLSPTSTIMIVKMNAEISLVVSFDFMILIELENTIKIQKPLTTPGCGYV